MIPRFLWSRAPTLVTRWIGTGLTPFACFCLGVHGLATVWTRFCHTVQACPNWPNLCMVVRVSRPSSLTTRTRWKSASMTPCAGCCLSVHGSATLTASFWETLCTGPLRHVFHMVSTVIGAGCSTAWTRRVTRATATLVTVPLGFAFGMGLEAFVGTSWPQPPLQGGNAQVTHQSRCFPGMASHWRHFLVRHF